METVTPLLESGLGTRTYEHDGQGVVICYSARISMAVEPRIEKGKELFRIKLPPADAEDLMHDLYYGEYTGS